MEDFESQVSSRYENDFEVIRKIGKGAGGHVFACKNKIDEMEYAVKVIPFYKSDTEIILREVRSFARMDHPNVVRYYHAWIEVASKRLLPVDSEDDESSEGPLPDFILYIAMELCESNLEAVLREDIQPPKALQLFKEIVAGVKHIHGEGLVHRDLTRHNIYIGKGGNIKIGDFGLAKYVGWGSSPSKCTPEIGTPFYMAPEMKKNQVSQKSDVYSLGVLFYELFNECIHTDSERVILLSNLANSGKVSAFWEAKRGAYTPILMGMLHDDESERPTAEELYSTLLLLQDP